MLLRMMSMDRDDVRGVQMETWGWIAEFAVLHFGDQRVRVENVVLRRERRSQVVQSMFGGVPMVLAPGPWTDTIIGSVTLVTGHPPMSVALTAIDDTPAIGYLRYTVDGRLEVQGVVDAEIGSALLPSSPPSDWVARAS